MSQTTLNQEAEEPIMFQFEGELEPLQHSWFDDDSSNDSTPHHSSDSDLLWETGDCAASTQALVRKLLGVCLESSVVRDKLGR